MISRLAYVCCDRCGEAADADAMADDATEARKRARRFGFVRRRSADATSKSEDLCPRCASIHLPAEDAE